MKTMFKNREFKVGDEVSSFWIGGVVIEVTNTVAVKHNNNETVSYWLDGKSHKDNNHPSIWHTDNNPFEMAGKYLDVKQKIERLLDALHSIATGTQPCNDREAYIFVDVAKNIAEKALFEFNGIVDTSLEKTSILPTETPIEQLKEGDSVWCIEKVGEFKKGDKQVINNLWHYRNNYIEFTDKKMILREVFFDYFTTIPPVTTTTTKPKINRAELLQLVVLTAHDFDNAEKCIKFNIQLLNEVNKVTDGDVK